MNQSKNYPRRSVGVEMTICLTYVDATGSRCSCSRRATASWQDVAGCDFFLMAASCRFPTLGSNPAYRVLLTQLSSHKERAITHIGKTEALAQQVRMAAQIASTMFFAAGVSNRSVCICNPAEVHSKCSITFSHIILNGVSNVAKSV